MKSKCCLRLTRCWANGSFSSSLVNRRFWTCNTAKPLTVLRSRARGNYPSHRKAACPWWHEKELLHCCKRRKIQTVLEFFAVGDSPTAVLFRTVKGGGKLPQHKISTVFKVHLSLFSLARFFIGHLTLSRFVRIRHYGLLSCRNKSKKMTHCRNLLGCKKYISALKNRSAAEMIKLLYNIDVCRCSSCGGKMVPHLPDKHTPSVLAHMRC